MAIEILAEQVIGQIAAGEVVERPASVIKELIENALDAGAGHVHIAVEAGGRRLMRVSDDGSGIPAEEIELAFARHATSKLRSVDDLDVIRTLGFRGEALSSIAAVSRVSVTSRDREAQVGTQLRIEGGSLVQRQALGAPAGTVIAVENLFFNTPARLKFLKKETTEKRYIATLITRYAMAYPGVRFVLEQDGREVFRSTGSGELGDVLVRSLSLEQFRQMVAVNVEDTRAQISVGGYASLPELTRADRGQITLFVNGRWIQDSNLTYAVVQAYHGLLRDGRFPIAVLMINLPPQEVDVNVHPTKAEVRFRDARGVFSVVQRGLREAVTNATDAVSRAGSRFSTMPEPATTRWNSHLPQQLDLDMEQPEQSVVFPGSDPDDDPTAIPEGMGAPRKPRTLPMLRVVGQVGAMYIIAEGPAGIYLIDQHAAHARVLYEALSESSATQNPAARALANALTVEVRAQEATALEAQLDLLRGIGFEIEGFGPNTFALRAVPELLGTHDPTPLIQRIAGALAAEGGDPLDVVCRQVALYAAIKTGQVIDQATMETLVRQLERCTDPFSGPDGHVTLLHMSGDQLAREFGRT